MALVELHKVGLVQLTVSQNVDGLHRRSNLDPKQLAELHGNTNLERCKRCGREYMRDFRTREARGLFLHETSRKCDDPQCRGQLLDSIVNFGEQLPDHELTKAFNGADRVSVWQQWGEEEGSNLALTHCILCTLVLESLPLAGMFSEVEHVQVCALPPSSLRLT